MNNFKTFSAKQTKDIARLLCKDVSKKRLKIRGALIFALTGNLGGGKTTFVQGFLRAAGVRKKITSPTFVIVKSYKVKSYKVKSYKAIYHLDCYRIKNPKELSDLGLREILNNPRNIVLIEWAEKIKKVLSKKTIWLKFQHGDQFNQRLIKIKMFS